MQDYNKPAQKLIYNQLISKYSTSTLWLDQSIMIYYWCCWGVHCKDMNQMAQESNTARIIAVKRDGPLSRPLIFVPQTNQENTQIVSFTLQNSVTTYHKT